MTPRVPVCPLGDIINLALYHQPLVGPQGVLLDLLPGVEADLRLRLPRLAAFLTPFPHGATCRFVFLGRSGGDLSSAPLRDVPAGKELFLPLYLSRSPGLCLCRRSCPPCSLSLSGCPALADLLARSAVPPRLVFPVLMHFILAHSPGLWEARPLPHPPPGTLLPPRNPPPASPSIPPPASILLHSVPARVPPGSAELLRQSRPSRRPAAPCHWSWPIFRSAEPAAGQAGPGPPPPSAPRAAGREGPASPFSASSFSFSSRF